MTEQLTSTETLTTETAYTDDGQIITETHTLVSDVPTAPEIVVADDPRTAEMLALLAEIREQQNDLAARMLLIEQHALEQPPVTVPAAAPVGDPVSNSFPGPPTDPPSEGDPPAEHSTVVTPPDVRRPAKREHPKRGFLDGLLW